MHQRLSSQEAFMHTFGWHLSGASLLFATCQAYECMQGDSSMQKLLALSVHGNARQVCGLTNQSGLVAADLFPI